MVSALFRLLKNGQSVNNYLLIWLLNTKNLNEIKLRGAITSTGRNLAYFASIPDDIKVFNKKVPSPQNKIRLIRYLIPDFE